ncbi:MAG: hypothetical protein KBS62_07385 [Oscillospiraceae bacterium]|nr:hypothetical protein [Candidatus Ruminococcus equi]
MKHNRKNGTMRHAVNKHFERTELVKDNSKAELKHSQRETKSKDATPSAFNVIPKKTLIFAMLIMLVFGFISTTFAAYFATAKDDTASGGSLIGSIRTAKIEKDNKDADISSVGANADIAGTGYDFSNVSFIFDNTNTNWNDNRIMLMIGHSSYSSTYQLTKIPNTNLYGYSGLSWGGCTEFCVIGVGSSGWGSEGNSPSSRKGYATHYTNVVKVSGNYNGFFQAKGASSTNNCTLTFDYVSNGYSYFNKQQTCTTQARTSSTGTYSSSNAPATVKISGYQVNGNTTSTTQSATATKGSSYTAQANFAKSSTVKLEYSSKSDSYDFDGWYNSSGTRVGTGTSYTYTCTDDDANITARFTFKPKLTISESGGTGTATINGTSTKSAYVTSGADTTLSITAPTNYYIKSITGGSPSWTTDGKTSKSGKINITSDTTLTVTYAKPSITVTSMIRNGTTTFSQNTSSSTTYNYNQSVTLTAPFVSGYTFKGWATTKYTTDTPTYLSTSTPYSIGNVTEDKTYYAYYTKNVSVTVTPTSKQITLGESVTLTATASGGTGSYTYEYKKGTTSLSTSNPATISGSTLGVGNSTVTVTAISDGLSNSANSTITVVPNTPTISTFTYPGDYVGGDGAISPTVTTNCVNTQVLSYEITQRPTGATASDSTVNATTGAFSAVVPGTYKVKVTCIDRKTISSVNYDSAPATKEVSVAVKPVKPTLNFSYDGTYKQGGNPITPTYWYTPSYTTGTVSVTESFSCDSSSCTVNAQDGSFYSDVPGTYSVVYTVSVTVNGQTTSNSKTASVTVLPAAKYTVSFTAKSRDGYAGYADNTALNSVLSGGGDVTEGNATTLIAPEEANASSKKWYFRGFMKNGGSLTLGTKDGNNYKLDVTNVQSAQTYYAYYSTAPSATVPSYSTNVNSGDNFTLTVSNASGGSGAYYYTYSFVPYGSAENYQRSNSNTITVTKPSIGHYIFKLRIHSDEVDSTTSLRESYKQLVESQDIYVLHPSEQFTAQFTDPQGFTGDGTQGNPYRVGKDHNCTITIIPTSGGQGTYYYKFGNNAYSTTNTYTLPVSTEGVGSRNITCSMYFVDSSGVASAESSVTIYYYIYSTFAIVKGDVQRIYTDNQLSSLDIKAEAGDASSAYKVQFAISGDGVNFENKGERLSFEDIDDRLLAIFHVNDYLNDSGIAYFRAQFYENDTESGSDFVHTFIGARSTASTKSIYFKNNSGTAIDMTANRLMACFRNAGGEQSWVTMQRVSDSETFRASVPIGYSDNVIFFIMDSSKYNTDYDSITDTFYLAKSAEQSLSTPLGDGKYMFTMNSITGTTINPSSPAWAVYSN